MTTTATPPPPSHIAPAERPGFDLAQRIALHQQRAANLQAAMLLLELGVGMVIQQPEKERES